jgi:methylated-DNA-protein-cysteine methyltransferase-like protein
VNADPRLERERRILDVLMALGPGEVTTYGDVADVAGFPKQSRLVGRILATTDMDVPWWRVVNAAGRIVSGHPDEQRSLLRSEGVTIVGDRVTDAPVGRFFRGLDRRGSIPVARGDQSSDAMT